MLSIKKTRKSFIYFLILCLTFPFFIGLIFTPFTFSASPLIVIDAGHGGYDSGAVGRAGLKEKFVNLDVALRLRNYLKKSGARVLMTRSTDKFVSLRDRVIIANRAHANRFVAIHHNSSGRRSANGTETYLNYSARATALDMANKAEANLVSSLGLSNRGVKRAGFYVIKHTKMPSILTEGSFISNPSEERRLKSAAYREKEAKAIFYALKRHMPLNVLNDPIAITGSSEVGSNLYYAHVLDLKPWHSFITLKNNDSNQATATITVFRNNGTIAKSQNQTIAANAKYSFYLRNFLGGDIDGGSIEITSTSSLLSSQLMQTNTQRSSLGALTAQTTPADTLDFPRVVDDSKNYRTFFAIKNASTSTASVAIKFYDLNGNLTKTFPVDIGAKAKYEFYPKDLGGADFSGSITVTSPDPNLIGYQGQRNLKKTAITLNSGSQSSNALNFVNVEDGVSVWHTSIHVKNNFLSAENAKIDLYDNNGTLLKTVNVNINPKAVYSFYPRQLLGSSFQGSIQITSPSSDLTGIGLKNNISRPSFDFTLPQNLASTLYFSHVDDGGNTYSSLIAVKNVAASSRIITINYYDNFGNLLKTLNYTLGANAKYNFSPWDLINTKFNGSINISTSDSSLVGYLCQYR